MVSLRTKAGGVAWLEENIRGDEEDRSYDEMYEKNRHCGNGADYL